MSKYNLEEILRGLTAVAYANGNANRARRDLAQAGIKIPTRTLRGWVNDTHKEQYEHIRTEVLPKVGAQVADEHMELARKQLEIAGALADRLKAEGKDLPIRDVANAMRNADVGAGIHTEKARDLQGDFGTPSKAMRSADEILRKLQSIGVIVEGTAEEIEPDRPALPGGD